MDAAGTVSGNQRRLIMGHPSEDDARDGDQPRGQVADRYVLVADVGGTNTRIALAALGQSVASFTERARIADVDGLRALVERSAAEIGGVHKIHHCVFGFAGHESRRLRSILH